MRRFLLPTLLAGAYEQRPVGPAGLAARCLSPVRCTGSQGFRARCCPILGARPQPVLASRTNEFRA
jgi:hypothetical protein